MKQQEPFSLRKRILSFRYALQGMAILLRDEHNARIHVAVMLAVILTGFLLGITATEWCAVLICFGMVLMAEAMNSAIEAIADLVMPGQHPLIKKAKDVAAAGVLFTAMSAVATGLVIFIPHLLILIKNITQQ
ncbi:MAG: diacylglycerol kinase family protein [Muribaculum sp.]|nr:diacylglycerol kinase family protein [Muribaculum sp.]